jgi:hypothetical protein
VTAVYVTNSYVVTDELNAEQYDSYIRDGERWIMVGTMMQMVLYVLFSAVLLRFMLLSSKWKGGEFREWGEARDRRWRLAGWSLLLVMILLTVRIFCLECRC